MAKERIRGSLWSLRVNNSTVNMNSSFGPVYSSIRFDSTDADDCPAAKLEKKLTVDGAKRSTVNLADAPMQTFQHPHREQEPLESYPKGVNPKTGEIGGPKGPEPTRYGDWERKGRVSDF
ncbi:unnamed protein product [Cyprideis torosa]|uniref:Succinate dehydrogenase assembly factor 4, mitochondrial n=1 Tax=Cyprideis torosa TaxID=163714 RepID=A0A7R8ZJS9_9CRUS|nr:unnamed protein product [Cyprideis torosa]CAG0882947.1 unnamed protein product [Cyprideis torosa]